jgi:regulatory protein
LHEGQEIDEPEVQRVVREEEKRSARECALNVLSFRDRSKKEIRDKLVLKGYSPEIADTVIGDLGAVGLVDEKRFARAWIRDRLQFGHKGKRLARVELLKKGVAKDTIAEAFTEEPLDEETIAREVVQKYANRLGALEPRKRKKRLYDLLLRRGFSFNLIQKVLNIEETNDGATTDEPR